jgi:hypothetical protein
MRKSIKLLPWKMSLRLHEETYEGKKMCENNKTSLILFSIGAGMLFGAAATMSGNVYSMYFLLGSQFFIIAGAISSSAHFTRRFDEVRVDMERERRDMYSSIHAGEDNTQTEMDALRRELAEVERRICTPKQKGTN